MFHSKQFQGQGQFANPMMGGLGFTGLGFPQQAQQ